VVGAALLVGGIVLLVSSLDDDPENKPKEHFKFMHINKEFAEDEKNLKNMLERCARPLPPQVEKTYEERHKALIEQRATRIKEQEEALEKAATFEGCESLEELEQEKRALYRNVYVINLDMDMAGKAVGLLSQIISLLLRIATPHDEVVVVLHNPGGSVSGHGLGSSHLQRLRSAKIPVTVCVDEVAASGGYMMACVANKIVAAPFSIVGSIGVLCMIPNFQRILKDNGIDPYLITAGQHKRTIDVIGEVTEEKQQKLQEELDTIHAAFKSHVARFRPQINIEQVATGEHWLAVDSLSLGLGLVDQLATSDDYLQQLARHCNVILIEEKVDEHWLFGKFGLFAKASKALTGLATGGIHSALLYAHAAFSAPSRLFAKI